MPISSWGTTTKLWFAIYALLRNRHAALTGGTRHHARRGDVGACDGALARRLVRNACVQSTPSWYDNYTNFAGGSRGTYFLNYWYTRPFWMSSTASAVVAATGDTYTAMSEKEFFANAYAEYFEDPAGYNDHSLWGGSLPESVKTFFSKHIVQRQPYTPPATATTRDAQNAPTPPSGGMAGTP